MAIEKNAKKEKIAISIIFLLLTVGTISAMVIGLKTYHDHDHDHDDEGFTTEKDAITTSNKAIQLLCDPTSFKQTCLGSLKSATSNINDPKELVKLAFDVAKKHVLDSLNKVISVVYVNKNNDPRGAQGVEICKELLESSVIDMDRSINQIKDFNINAFDQLLMENLQVWISGALTFHETCIDAFENSTSDLGKTIKDILKTSKELTSHTLSMVSKLTLSEKKMAHVKDLIGSSNSRLLETLEHQPKNNDSQQLKDLPSWMNDERRHIMKLLIAEIQPNVTVSKDGSGDFKTIMEAVNLVPNNNVKAFIIYIKEGVYEEYVAVDKNKVNVIFIGDGPHKTKITGSKNFVDGYQTYKTATVDINGDGFMARDISFENTAGPTKHQAVAVRVTSDFSIFYNCGFEGYQDTLYAVRSRQFYRHCSISGTIDFIFGDAMAIFQNCKITIRKPLENQQCIVTAQGRLQSDGPGAFVLQNCSIGGELDYYQVKDQNKAFLGRPWKEFSRTIIIQSFIDDAINSDGWTPWEGDFGLDTLFYTEFDNRGDGAIKDNRVKWNGIKQLTANQVEDFTLAKFFVNASSWLNPTGVPYYTTMIKSNH